MSLSEKRKKDTASEMIPSEEHDSKAKIPIQQKRPSSPVPMDHPVKVRGCDISTEPGPTQQKRPSSPVPSCVSMKSDRSMDRHVQFTEGGISTEQRDQQGRSESEILSGQSVQSHQTDRFSIFNSDEKKEISAKDEKNMNQKELVDTVEKSQTLLRLHQKMKTKLKEKYQMLCEGNGLHENHTFLKDIYTDLYITEGGNRGVNKEHEVRQIEMASKRQTTPETPIKCNDIFKPIKQHQEQYCSPGLLIRNPTSKSLNHEDMFSDSASSSHKHGSEVPLVHLHGHDKPIIRKGMRNLTKGIAGIGKTVSVQKVILDWAEGKANQDVHLIIPLPFRDLNLKKDNIYSLMQLLSHYFPEMKEVNRIEDDETKILFIFDGLDECRLPLDFINNKKCYDVTEPTSVDVLLTNLIEGNLFPSALLWITTRPAAANQIPSECVDQVTEIRGFNDPQKEEYFRKKITDQNLANEIIHHIKTSRSLHIMCHIPVFCWISATVLESMLKEAEKDEIPKTLTQMYEHFLLIQTSMKNKKYNNSTVTNERKLSQSDKDMILKLSKLAFKQLQEGNLIFYEEDLRECGIDVTEASEYSTLCTEIFKEELGCYHDKVFSFVHLSIQEFLAAIHALETCLDKKENVFPPVVTQCRIQHDNDYDHNELRKSEKLSDLYRGAVDQSLRSENGHLDLCQPDDDDRFYSDDDDYLFCSANDDDDDQLYSDNDDLFYYHDVKLRRSDTLSALYRRAVDQSLESETGHLDLFLRFLLGLSLESNQNMSCGLLTQTGSTTQSNEETVKSTVEYLSKKIRKESSPERIINLFHCLNELGANSLVEEMKTFLQSGALSESELQPHQCSALAYLLLMSEEVLEEFDMKTYKTSEEGYQRLLPVVKTCKRALLSSCGITEKGCASLVSALESNPSHLKVLDLSKNLLYDTGVENLSALLKDPQCRLETLRLAFCGITEKGCASLVSALKSNPTHLKELDLSNNDLKDTGVEKLSALLMDPQCRLQNLRLSGCLVTEEGCTSLASALKSNPSHLKELDLSYNYPGDQSLRLLSAGLEDPHWRLEKLNKDHGGERMLKSGPKKYACDLTLDPNTVNRNLLLSEENRTVTRREKEQLYPDHPDRFGRWPLVLCREGLSGHRYWEVEWSGGWADIGVVYKGINRRGGDDDQGLGFNDKSWCVVCHGYQYFVRHKKNTTQIHVTSSGSHRVGVYLDWPAGTLSFYRVSSDTLTHLYTFNTTFTEPLYPGFGIAYDSSVSLCQMVPVSITT